MPLILVAHLFFVPSYLPCFFPLFLGWHLTGSCRGLFKRYNMRKRLVDVLPVRRTLFKRLWGWKKKSAGLCSHTIRKRPQGLRELALNYVNLFRSLFYCPSCTSPFLFLSHMSHCKRNLSFGTHFHVSDFMDIRITGLCDSVYVIGNQKSSGLDNNCSWSHCEFEQWE